MSGLDWTRCPHCHLPLEPMDRTLRCGTGHSYDLARQGYVNLLGRTPPVNADTAEMLDARARFLGAGHYDAVADAVASAVADAVSGLPAPRLVEVGAGTGFYLARALDRCPDGEGLASDVSVPAAKRAARAHPRAASIVADTWAGLPLRDAVADAVICVFAPRNPADFARVLRPGGGLIVAQPAPEHLGRLRSTHGLLSVGGDKAERLGAAFAGWETAATVRVRADVSLDAGEVRDLIAMGPNAFHGVPDEIEATEVEIAVDVVRLVRPAA